MKALSNAWLLAFILCLCSFLSACSTTLPPQTLAHFDQCREDAAIDILSSLTVKEKDVLLYDLALLSLGVHGNQSSLGIRHGKRALSNMWSLGNEARGKTSMVSSEAARDYKGEPYEKTMAGIYLGSLFFNQGDFENARASFQKAVLGNQYKAEGQTENVPLAHFLLAKTFFILGQEDNAKISLVNAKKYSAAFDGIDLQDLPAIHTVIVAEMGSAPLKQRTGPGKSLIQYLRRDNLIAGANVLINGQYVGQTKMVEDLYAHALQNERDKKEALQTSKGVLRDVSTIVALQAASQAGENKDAAKVAAVAGLLALLNQSQADTRQWQFLPSRLHIAALSQPLKQGLYEFSLDFVSPSNTILPGYRQVWRDARQMEPKIYIKKARNCY